MKRLTHFLLSISVLFGAALLITPLTAQAYDPLDGACSQKSSAAACQTGDPQSDPIVGKSGILTKVTQFMVYALGVVSVVAIIIAGIRFVVSQGDPNSVSSARNTIIYAVVGLCVAIFAQAIVTFVLSKL